MKRFLSIFAVAVLLTGIVVAATWRTGEGKILAATTTPAKFTWTNEIFNTLSVYNSDATNTVFCLVNTTTNVLDTRMTAGTALPIPAGASYTFDAQAHGEISSICYATTNGTATVFAAGY